MSIFASLQARQQLIQSLNQRIEEDSSDSNQQLQLWKDELEQQQLADIDLYKTTLSSEDDPLTESDDTSATKGTSVDYGGKSNPKDLLNKLLNVGTPLRVLIRPGEIHIGITPGYMRAFEIDEFTCEQLNNDDPKSVELIRPFLKPREWMGESAHVICIPSSRNKRWPWTDKTDEEAERIFERTYPAISAHMKSHRDELERRGCYKTRSAVFYWELPAYGFYDDLKRPKIFYPPKSSTMQASCDTT